MRGSVMGVATVVALAALALVPAGASAAYDAKLKRYPYLTDLVSTSVMVNWATDISATSGVVKYGPVGNCTANTATATRTFIFVNGVSEYQWKAQITGLTGSTQYCYRVYLGSAQLDLLGTDASPVFTTQVPAGSTEPFKFAVWGNWGKVGPSGNPNQANVISQIAASGSRFAVTTGDNAYEVGSQKNYGDLYQTGDNTSAVFAPNFWKVAGASLPAFPAIGNHDHNSSTHLVNWPQDTAVATSGGHYQMDNYCCTNGTNQMDYPTGWYAFDAGLARFYVLETAWEDTNVGTANLFKNDFDNHWGPNSPQYQWLKNDLETHPRALRFAFHHFPLYSDQSSSASDTWLQGANSLEGLLKLHDVTVDFSAHSHNYQRNSIPAGGVQTYVSGGGGANLESIGTSGCSGIDQYGLGWSNQSNVGSACGAAPVPATKDRVHHFLLVSVNGTSVTVTPTDELGRTFDPVTYNAPAMNANLVLTKQDAPDPVLVGQQVTYFLDVGNFGPRAATDVQVTDTLPAGMIFDSATTTKGTCGHASGIVTCQLGTIGGGANHEFIQIKGRPQSTGTINNTATVASSINDPVPANNTSSTSTTVNPSADLAVTKTDSPDPVAQGTPLTYTVGVSNAGPSSATGITLTDTLPPGVTFNSATPTQGSCSHSSGTVSCSLGTLANTASATVTINVTPQSVGSITNQANVISLTGDPNTTNNGASAVTTVGASANLSLTKSDAPDPVLVGQPLTYTLTTQNAGPSSASSVQLTDTLPAGVTYNSATPSQGSCSHSSGTVSCSLGTINNAGNATVTIQVTPQAQGSITNTANVTSAATDTNLANNSASATTTVDPVADLAVTKSDSPDPALVGQPLTYTVGVQNTGPSSAPSVSLNDSLPAGVTFNSAVPSQGSCSQSAGTVNCPLGTIANGATASVQITVTPQSTASLTNTASASSSISDPTSANNSASAVTTVNPSANLGITKTDSPDPVLQGSELTYTLNVSNAGPSGATGVTVTDTLPAGVTFTSATPSQGSCTQSAGTVTCPLGTIANGGSASVQIKITPPSTGNITNTASVSSDVNDPSAANNSASASTTVDPVADLSITKSDAPDPVSSGEDLVYTVGVQNAGPSGATGVTVTDTLPAGVTFQSATPSQGTCNHTSGTVTCPLGTLANGGNASVQITVRPTTSGSITNQANVTAATADPALVNNAASTSTTVDPVADLALTKSDSPDPVLSGGELTYTLGVSNHGPATATGVSLSDTLPAGATFVSATPTQGSCVRSGSTVTCALGTIPNGGNPSVEIKVTAGAPGTITNNATVLSTATDPTPADNSASAVTTVKPVADLALTKSDAPDPVLAGELLTYTLGVSNGGPHDAPGVTVTDDLPAGVTYVSATPTQGSCSESGGTVTCALGTVTNGGNAGVDIKVRPQSEGSITNQASVSSDAGDLNASNDSASAGTTVDPAADLELTKTDSADPVLSGDQLTYTLAVHNAGPSAASAVALSDTLPGGVTFESVSTTDGSCLQSGNSVLCSLGTLADEADATVQITVTADAVGTLSNTANVLSMTADADTADNAAAQNTTVNPVAALSLSKTDSPDPVPAGELLTYSLTVQNAGPQGATGVVVTDTLPAGVTFESATPTQGSCSESGGTVTCALGTVANGTNAGVEIKVRPQQDGQITNSAAVTANEADRASGDNSASESTTVDPSADLSLTKTDSPDPVLAGELITYSLSVANAGPSAAAAAQLIDNLPAGATFDSATSTQGSCSYSAGIVDCSLGTIASGGSAGVEIKVRVNTPGTVTNEAGVASSVGDPAAANNSATAQTTVDPAADLSLTKSDAEDPVLEGDQIAYTLDVDNAGPQDATGVELTDTLPAGVTFDSATPTQGSCSETAGTVTCPLGTIADGATASVDIVVTPQAPGTYTNQATLSSALADPDSADRTANAETTVRPIADISLTKTDSPDPVVVEELLTYTISVQNAGPSSATGVTLTDTLPAGVTFDSATPTQGTCSESGGTVTCALGTIASSAGASIDISVRPQNEGTVTNNADVVSEAHDPTTADNSASAETTVTRTSDLSLTKTDSPDPVLAGELLTYALTIDNAGPSSATGVTLTDTLPAGVTFDSATPTQGTCAESGGTVTCALGTLASGAGADVDIKVRTQAPGTITNSAEVVSLAEDANPADNSASAETTVDPAADLSLTKGDSPDPVLEGEQLTYSLAVQNAGPQDATGVTMTDTLPAGVNFNSATPSQGTCLESTGTVTCDLGTLADEGSASVEITVTPQGPGTITNQASVTSDLGDPDSADRTASAETRVRPVSDLTLTKSDAPDPVLAGEELTYTLTVDNAGPRDATNTQLTDTLPAAATFVSATPSQGTCSEASGTVTCALGTVADQGSATVEIKVTPQEGGTITNQANVSADEADPTPGDNAASVDTTVNPAADLELTKTDSPDPVLAGELLTYTVSVHNAGPSSAPAVQVADTLPPGVTFVSATPSQGSCSETAGIVDCALGTLANGATAGVEIKVRPQAAGTITNAASAVSLAVDGDAADNSASADTTVDGAANLSLTKTDSPDPVLVGQELTYALTVQNSGPETATAVNLTDTLPAGVTFVSATPTQGTCAESTGTVTCDLGSIADEGSAGVEIKVTPDAVGTITNEASVSSELGDPNPADNSASEQTVVDPVADLTLSKSDSPDPVLVEELLTYSLSVQNGGPSSATGVSLTDTLPGSVTYESATPTQGSCSESGGTVTCALGTIANGAGATVEIKVRPQSAGTITNQADVTSDVHDPVSADNSASAQTTVDRVADLSLTKSDSQDPAVVGERVTYTLTVNNAGPSHATGVSLTDTLPGGVTYESATPSQGTCSQASGTVTCALGTIANGADATVTIDIRPQSAGTITNQAAVTSSAVDPTSSNDTASADTTVTPFIGYVRPAGATPVIVPFVPAYSACSSPNAIHGTPLNNDSCKPPTRASDHLTIGTAESNGAPTVSIGSARFTVIVDPPNSDVGIKASITDIRCGTATAPCGNTNTVSGPDYTGELQLVLPLRITDRFSGAGGGVAATVSDTTFPVTMTCTQTGNQARGSACDVLTSANAVLPGVVPSGRRAIWEIDRAQLFDGGPDGVASTAGNGLFANQGVFVP